MVIPTLTPIGLLGRVGDAAVARCARAGEGVLTATMAMAFIWMGAEPSPDLNDDASSSLSLNDDACSSLSLNDDDAIPRYSRCLDPRLTITT